MSDRLPESPVNPKAPGAYVDDAESWNRLIYAIVGKPADDLAETWTVLTGATSKRQVKSVAISRY